MSVVVPAYNVAPYLERALDSALAQTMSDLEVIVVDDGSTDATRAIAQRLAANEPRVRLICNERNVGEARTRSIAQRAARGQWLAPLDGDDAWMPERLERLLSTPGAASADVVADDVYRVEMNRHTAWSCLRHRWQAPLTLSGPRWLTAPDLVRHHLGVLQPLIRRGFLERHRIEFPNVSLAGDFYFYLELALAGARWLQVPEGYYVYFVRPGSITAAWVDQGQELLAHHRALLDHAAVRSDDSLRAVVRAFIAEEQASVLLETVWRELARRRLSTALSRMLREVGLLPRAGVLAVRHALARRRRARSRLCLVEDQVAHTVRVVAA